jgi:hypothetical protein
MNGWRFLGCQGKSETINQFEGCMFEGINHGGMNQTQWGQLNFGGVCGFHILKKGMGVTYGLGEKE